MSHPALATLQQSLTALLGDRASCSEAVRAHHGHDESSHPDALPDLVVWPHSTEEVSAIALLCHAHRVPMIPYGAGGIAMMQAIKQALDPLQLLNPGKIFAAR